MLGVDCASGRDSCDGDHLFSGSGCHCDISLCWFSHWNGVMSLNLRVLWAHESLLKYLLVFFSLSNEINEDELKEKNNCNCPAEREENEGTDSFLHLIFHGAGISVVQVVLKLFHPIFFMVSFVIMTHLVDMCRLWNCRINSIINGVCWDCLVSRLILWFNWLNDLFIILLLNCNVEITVLVIVSHVWIGLICVVGVDESAGLSDEPVISIHECD